MTLDEYKLSLSELHPPAHLSPLLKALWYDGKGDWEKAHEIAQDVHSNVGSWVHAYLHRKEGDEGNASYWYHRAGKVMPKASLSEEWESIAKDFLSVKD